MLCYLISKQCHHVKIRSRIVIVNVKHYQSSKSNSAMFLQKTCSICNLNHRSNNRIVLTIFIQIINIKIVNRTINNYMINDLICHKNNAFILSTMIKKTCLKKFFRIKMTTIMIMTMITRRNKKKFEKIFHEHVEKQSQNEFFVVDEKIRTFFIAFSKCTFNCRRYDEKFSFNNKFYYHLRHCKKINNFDKSHNKSKFFAI